MMSLNVELLPDLEPVLHAVTQHSAGTRLNAAVAIPLLLSHIGNVNVVDKVLRTPLHNAAARACAASQSSLLLARADVNAKDSSGQTPLHLLVRRIDDGKGTAFMRTSNDEAEDMRRAAMVKELIACAADVNVSDSMYPPLFLAANAGRCAVLRALLDGNADVSKVCSTGGTVLHSIMSLASEVIPADTMRELVSDLVRRKANVTATDSDGRTPLHIAVCNGREDAVQTLCTKQADVSARDRSGITPLHAIAESKADAASVQKMMKCLVDVRTWDLDSIRDSKRRTPLHCAALLGQNAFLNALIGAKAAVMCRDQSQATPLHLAAEACLEPHAEEAISALLAARADPRATDAQQRTPLDCVASRLKANASANQCIIKLLKSPTCQS